MKIFEERQFQSPCTSVQVTFIFFLDFPPCFRVKNGRELNKRVQLRYLWWKGAKDVRLLVRMTKSTPSQFKAKLYLNRVAVII